MDYKTLILTGKSTRQYKKAPIQKEAMDELKAFSKSVKGLHIDENVELLFLSHDEVYHRLENVAGYKGHMIEAPSYMLILSNETPFAIENAGYIGQKLIWKAQELLIDSCWITFQDGKQITARLDLDANKSVTGLIAIGYSDETQGVKVTSSTKTGGNYSKAEIELIEEKKANRLAVEEIVFDEKWGNNIQADKLEERGLLEAFAYSRFAPSTLNRQPWRFLLDNNVVILAVRDDEYVMTYEEMIDAGIIMLYFGSIMESTLFTVEWKIGKPEKEYQIPSEYKIVAHCKI